MERIEDVTYKAQQRQRQGRTLDAIRLFEQALELRIDLHGPESTSVKKACDNLSDILNGAALKHLQCEEYEEARKLLQKAEMLSGPDDLISAVTYNNIACYYRRKNKLRTALKYLEKAQRIEMKSRVVANPAGTRLNLCAVLSQLERHNEALEHAQAAVVLLQEELSQMEPNGDYDGDNNPETLNKMAVLAISYHNIGVEEEYLKRIPASLAAYKKGVQIAREYLGPDNDITRTLVKSCKAAQEHLDAARMKKGFSPPGIIRQQGESMGGAYDALHEHKSVKRRAQSAGLQRSASATPSWMMEGERSLSRPSTAHIGAGNKSLSSTRAWVDDDRNGNASFVSAEKGPLRSDAGDRSRMAYDREVHSQQDHRRDGYSDDFKDSGLGARGMNGRQRPASALGIVGHRSGSSQSNYGSELEPLGQGSTSMGAKRGPKTPRQEESDHKVPTIRRPPSASLRQPVRTNLGNGIERGNLATQLKRVNEHNVNEEKHNQQENKSYAWEESNGLHVDDDEQDFVNEQFQDQGPSNRRVTYQRPAAEDQTAAQGGLSRSGHCSRDPASASRNGQGGSRGTVGVGGDGSFGGSGAFSTSGKANGIGAVRGIQLGPLDDNLLDNSSGNGNGIEGGRGIHLGPLDDNLLDSSSGNGNGIGGGRGSQLGPLDDDLLDNYEDAELDDDVDSGTDEIIQDRRMGSRYGHGSARPASASICRKQEGLPAARAPGRPASASIAVIQERRQRDRAQRPSSAAAARSAYGHQGVARTVSDSDHSVGRALDYSMPAKAERSNLRPASATVARPGSARPALSNGQPRPASASITSRISSHAMSRDVREDEVARNNQREEREILDILSDHSDYESDLELQAEAMKLSISSRNTNQHQRPHNSSMAANRSQNKYSAEDTRNNRSEESDDHPVQVVQRPQRRVRSDERGLDSKRAQLLAQTEIGMDHSDYESEDAAGGGGADRYSGAPREHSRDRHPALEHVNARTNDGQGDDLTRQVVGHQGAAAQRPSDGGRPQRPSDSGRPQRPSDTNRAPARPSDSKTSSRPAGSSAQVASAQVALPARHLGQQAHDSEYESNDEVDRQQLQLDRHDMSATLKWLEDGLSVRND